MKLAKPSIVIHMAAKSLVRQSYKDPIDTFMTNVIGTVNILEASKRIDTIKVILNVTSDKCYDNKELNTPFKEDDVLGGNEPYSTSKACSELISKAYKNSFFSKTDIHIATARAGNVIGGGDWADDRLIPDFLKSIEKNKPLILRSPFAVRPWQHVLEPLSGYLSLIEKLFHEGKKYSGSWNFGPSDNDQKTVEWIANKLCEKVPGSKWKPEKKDFSYESLVLKLDSSKAKKLLNWETKWKVDEALNKTFEWFDAFKSGNEMRNITEKQIKEFSITKT